MKRTRILLLMDFVLFMLTLTNASAQQLSVINLILTGFNEAHQGFPTLSKDTLPFDGWWNEIKPSITNQYDGVKDIKIKFEKNFKSLLLNDTPVKLNQMKITGQNINLGINKTWEDYKDTLTSYYNKIVLSYKQAFGGQLNYTQIIPLQNSKEAGFQPRYIIYFYEKSILIPDNLNNIYEIEKQLDVVSWFSIELKEGYLVESIYNIIYRISGGQRQ